MTEPPKRRRFQFRLRTLMTVVTLLAVPLGYVGWQAKIVRERKAWINNHPQHRLTSASYFTSQGILLHGDPAQKPGFVRQGLGHQYGPNVLCFYLPENTGDGEQGPGIIRRWLGDAAQSYIYVIGDDARNEGRLLFPEATIALVSGH